MKKKIREKHYEEEETRVILSQAWTQIRQTVPIEENDRTPDDEELGRFVIRNRKKSWAASEKGLRSRDLSVTKR